MRTNAALAAFLFTSVALYNGVVADDLDDLDSSTGTSTSTDTSTTTSIVRPSFTASPDIKGDFYEQFTDDWQTRWKVSHAKKEKDSKAADEEWAYVGEWSVEEPTIFPGIEGDKGLVVKNPAAHHAISSKFKKPIDNKGKTLVVQYEVKLQDGLECGGAYLKLLKDNKALRTEEFSNSSPYVIMFGPDKCGATNKVHFIFKHKNPKTGEYEEKHLTSPPMARISKTTTLYTLIVTPNQEYEIRIDGDRVKNGTLLADFTPAVNPDKEIDDPNDKKPEDWVDEAKIADPDAKKPEDWDEDAPYEIVDEDAVKPDDWLETEPQFVADPEAKKPEDWDDEEDGDWVAPQIPNPKCDEASGCGKWEKPMKTNPEYKGKWSAPYIDNPAYKGVWAPKKIKNPNYFEDKKPANFEPIGAIGFELWTMQANILFDNIYIGHSVEEAEKLQKATFDIKKPIEKADEDASAPKVPDASEEDPLSTKSFREDPMGYSKEKLTLFWTLFQKSPVNAVKVLPEVAGSLAVIILTTLTLLVGLFTMATGSETPTTVKKTTATVKDKAGMVKEAASRKVTELKDDAIANADSGSESDSKPRATRRSSKKTDI